MPANAATAYNIDERYHDCEALLPIIEQLRKAVKASFYGRDFIEDLIMGDNLLDERVALYAKLEEWAELTGGAQ